MFAVAAKTQQAADDHLRAAAFARPADRRGQDAQAILKIGAIDGMGGDAVTAGLVGQIMAGKLAVVRRGVGVLIVGDDQNQRQTFHRRLVQGFMKCARGSGAVADAGRAHRAFEFS